MAKSEQKDSCYNAMITLGKAEDKDDFDVIDVLMKKANPKDWNDFVVLRIYELIELSKVHNWYVEKIIIESNFGVALEYLAHVLADQGLHWITLEGKHNTLAKEYRIKGMQPMIQSCRSKLPSLELAHDPLSVELLIQELENYPLWEHIDGLDAWSMGLADFMKVKQVIF